MTFKQFFIGFSLLVCSFSQAQEKDYKPFLETLFLHAKTDFKDIVGEENETSIFRDSKLKPDIGEIKISIMSYGSNLNWTIPLNQSQKIRKDVDDFIKAKFSGNKDYAIADSYDLEDENFNTKNVYLKRGDRKPKPIFQTFYYKDNEDNRKSSFSMIIYGKK
jgi:hypothetical protein